MFALELNPGIPNFSKTHNCTVKQLPRIEKTIIRNVIGNDPAIPETIYNRVQEYLSEGKNVNAILKWRTDDNNSYWTISRFEPSANNKFKSQFSVSTKFTTKKCVNCTQKLYNTLLDIEKKIGIEYANKFLDGYLEEKCIDFNELAMLYN